MTLEHAKDNNLSCCTTTTYAFTNTAEVTFIDFNVPLEYFMSFFCKMKGDTLTYFSIEKSC